MHYFAYRDGMLACEEASLDAIARSVGTPTYVYSQRTLERHVRVLEETLGEHPHVVCYSIKANSNLTLLRRFREWGTGFNAVSGGELHRALQAGAPPERVILSGVGKTEVEIRQALEAGVLFLSVESLEELRLISAVAAAAGRTARVVFRTNPDVDPKTHPYISTGLAEHKFGIPFPEAATVYREAVGMPGIEVVGIGFHLGSLILELAPFEEALAKVTAFAGRLLAEGIPLRYLNVGGGVGITYHDETPPTLDAYAQAIRNAGRALGLTLVLEPGRVIVGNAGILLCRVIRRKRHGGKQFVIVDAGMNDLIRPALYGSYHALMPVRATDAPVEVVDVVGPICESADFIAEGRPLATLQAGDLLAVMSAGAYGFTMASNYNSRPRCAEVLVDGDRFSVVRRRETYEDLIRLEM